MYLKKVELNGFKSFADKTEFEFVRGITAVVGPNGSGKSNITDAIRWALGEQSAKSLRGAKMEDIIFAGSDSRKPVNFSEVTLILDNQDSSLDIEYSEVSITRRLYRSGDSEFFINNQAVRLKDISELLTDTGIGKEAYSIIGQGKIDEILSSKPEDRRGIFEEAAGIIKYKNRKRDAKKRLDETEQNLIRISDLISELYNQLEPLEKQSNVAKEYKEYANRLKDLNIQIYVHEIDHAYTEWKKAETQKKLLVNDQAEFSSMVSKADAIIEENRWNINKIEKELEVLHQELITVSEKLEQEEGKKEVLIEREKNHNLTKTQTIDSLDKQLSKKGETVLLLNKENEKLTKIEEQILNINKLLQEEESKIEQLLTDHEFKIESYKNEYFECLNKITTLRNESRHIGNSKENINARINKLILEEKSLQENNQFTYTEKEKIRKSLSNISEEKDKLSKKYSNNKENLTLLKEKYNNISVELAQQTKNLSSKESRYEVLSDMQNDFSGYHQGVKEILKLRDSSLISGVHGAVAELINVPKEYEVAIEIALGSSLQHIVINDEVKGREAIKYLKDNKLGRATFLPLNIIKEKQISLYDINKIKDINGYIGIASDLINFDTKYTNVLKYLLGQVIITTDLKAANEIAKELNYNRRIVTLEGDIVNPGGIMTGGSIQKKNAGLLGRQREIEEIYGEMEQLNQSISKMNNQYKNIDEDIKIIQKENEEIQNELENKRLKYQELQSNYKQLDYEFNNIEKQIIIIKQEIEQLRLDLDNLDKSEQESIKQIKQYEDLEIELQGKISQAETVRKQDESVKIEVNKQITEYKINLARLEQERDNINSLVERFTNELKELEDNIEQLQNNLIILENDLSVQQQDKELVKENIEQFREKKIKIQKDIEEIRSQKYRYNQEIENTEIESKDSRRKLKYIESELQKNEVKLNRLDVELENLLNKLRDEYEMSYEWAKQYIEMTEDIDLAKDEVKNLKVKIQSLGEVNLGAIEEYERVLERYNFLSSQKDDLIEAKETLYQIIEEVNEEMIKKFKESFDSIREEFHVVFTKLFGGGKADLILTDENNTLETGIEIVAQPPGKKLQNIALLSGGEKALTAITLLFSILRVKPVPFCVLDEVEAALDEANVTRFTEYLREFSELTQFIIVTHRKGTMEGADVLYGVTMQESGVSRLVSVKLEESEKVAQMI